MTTEFGRYGHIDDFAGRSVQSDGPEQIVIDAREMPNDSYRPPEIVPPYRQDITVAKPEHAKIISRSNTAGLGSRAICGALAL